MATISYTHDHETATGLITIDRPERRGALHHAPHEELDEALDLLGRDEPRAVVVWGTNDHFCSGADLSELEDLSFTRTLRGVLDRLAGLEVPTIAAIAGSCMGLGVQLALACDIRLAAHDARFAVPVARLGLMVDHWTVARLAAVFGPSTARYMVLTADPLDADRAFGLGAVHRLVEVDPEFGPGGTVLAAARLLAGQIAELAPLSLAGSKLGCDLLESDGGVLDPDGRYLAAFERAWASDDLVEGRRAFADRRPPVFRGE